MDTADRDRAKQLLRARMAQAEAWGIKLVRFQYAAVSGRRLVACCPLTAVVLASPDNPPREPGWIEAQARQTLGVSRDYLIAFREGWDGQRRDSGLTLDGQWGMADGLELFAERQAVPAK
jgi:hypothetical protein